MESPRSAPISKVWATVHEDGTLLRLELDRPKGNVLDQRMMASLTAALDGSRDSRPLRLVVLQGRGGHFSFGASVEEHRRDEAPGMLASFHRLIRAVAGYPVPIAALVEGRCLGGGFELALACPLLFAGDGATFGCPEVRLGVFPPVLAALGPRRLPGALAERLVLTGATIGASVLDAAGALAGRFEGDAWEGLLAWYRSNLAPLSAFALREATAAARDGAGIAEALATGLDAAEGRYLARILPSHDGNEGIEAFLARRAPRWEDR